ncbi:MAG TPA: tripartite tricarboxylate transporter TctB family protein [Cryomorphaceae bacterium]|nr:tripartite tricarboxylate transporter TctB family protein [Cryomorphaceae bacterium]
MWRYTVEYTATLYYAKGEVLRRVRMSLQKENTIIGILLFIFSGVYAFLTSQLPDRNIPNTLGANFMPYIFAGLLAFLSILLILEGVAKHNRGATGCDGNKLCTVDMLNIAALFGALIIYIFGIIYVGYLLVTPLFLAFLMYYGGSRKITEILLTSIIVTVVVYFLFHNVFMVPLTGIAF